MTFSTHPFSNLRTSSLNASTSRQQSSGRRSFSRRQRTTSPRAFSRLSGSWRTFFLSSSLARRTSIALETSCRLGTPSSCFWSSSPWWSGAGSAESFCCASRRDSASWARRRFSSAATRSWIRSSRAWRRETSVWEVQSAPAGPGTWQCLRARFRYLTSLLVSRDSTRFCDTPAWEDDLGDSVSSTSGARDQELWAGNGRTPSTHVERSSRAWTKLNPSRMDKNKSLGQLTLAGAAATQFPRGRLLSRFAVRQQATLFPNPWRCRLKEISGEH